MEIIFNNVSYINNKTILENLNFCIQSNKITGIIGKSGSGKTTLAEMLNLLILPSSGYINIFDKKIASNSSEEVKDIKNKIGLVFQNSEEQFFCSTVEKEIGFGLNYLNKDLSFIKKRIKDSLIMVGLSEDYLTRKISSLSCGEKKKVAIASILAINPQVLIFDEPTIGLDIKGQKSLINIIKMLKNRYNKTIIILSRDSDFVHKLCDNVIVIDNGQVVLSGNKYDVFIQNIEKYGLKKPKIIDFEQMVFERKNIKLIYRDDINDLMKDVYRSVK